MLSAESKHAAPRNAIAENVARNVNLFNFEGADVRVVTIDGEPWFVAKDVADLLGYADTDYAIRAHCKASQTWAGESSGQVRHMKIIPERDLYRLVMKSQLPAAERFEEWVVGEVLPSIRKTGGYQARPMTQLEIIAANAVALVEQARRIAATEQVVADLSLQVERVAESRVWDHCPQNCEPITKIRARIGKKYGFPAWVVDCVMRELPLSPKVHAMIRNGHENAGGSQYEVWAVADVTRTFARFAADCQRLTNCFVTHPDIDRPFRMAHEVAA